MFAQLTVSGKYQGPHVFVVRIRDDSGRVATGVRIEDNGPKMGLNGVDNGRIWFDDVRVPLDNLLDRYASVAPDGTYSSPIPTVSARFGAPPLGLAFLYPSHAAENVALTCWSWRSVPAVRLGGQRLMSRS